MAPCPTCGLEVDLLLVLEHVGWRCDSSDDTNLRATGSEDIIKYTSDNWFSYTEGADEGQIKLLAEKLKHEEDKGNKVAYINISYHDDVIKPIFNSLLQRKLVTVLWQED